MDLENAFLGKHFSDLSGTEVGMLKLILGDFILILACKSFGMRVDRMGFVFQAFHVSATLPEQLEIMIDSAEWDTCFLIDLFRSFLILQDGTNYFIPLKCMHSFASII